MDNPDYFIVIAAEVDQEVDILRPRITCYELHIRIAFELLAGLCVKTKSAKSVTVITLKVFSKNDGSSGKYQYFLQVNPVSLL